MEPSAMSWPAGALTNLWTGCAQVAPNCTFSVPGAPSEMGVQHAWYLHAQTHTQTNPTSAVSSLRFKNALALKLFCYKDLPLAL